MGYLMGKETKVRNSASKKYLTHMYDACPSQYSIYANEEDLCCITKIYSGGVRFLDTYGFYLLVQNW